jgi:hypothetical protein
MLYRDTVADLAFVVVDKLTAEDACLEYVCEKAAINQKICGTPGK